MNFKEPQGQLARWMEELSHYNMILRHRSGSKHGNADALSRPKIPVDLCAFYRVGVKLEELPCKGCKYCRKRHEEWNKFIEDVDEAIPLASVEKTYSIAENSESSKFGNKLSCEDAQNEESAVRNLLLCSEKDGPTLETFSEDGSQIAENCIKKRNAKPVKQLPGANAKTEEEFMIDNTMASNVVHSSIYKTSTSNVDYSCGDHVIENNLSLRCNSVVFEIDAGNGNQELKQRMDNRWSEEVITHIDVINVDGKIEILNCNTKSEERQLYHQNHDQNRGPSSLGFSIQDLNKGQVSDPDLRILNEWLKDGTEPAESALFLSSPAEKYYWINRNMFRLVDGVIYMGEETEHIKLDVPVNLRSQVLSLNHDTPSAGHQGIARTKAKVKEKFFWYNLNKDVANFVSSCPTCNGNKKSDRYSRCPLTEYQASAPMERIHLDFLGPLPTTPRGNQHVLMIVDQFTKWVECITRPSQTAEVTAHAAVNVFFSRFGCPLQIHSDQGRNFKGKLFAELCRALEIHTTRTTPYRPALNGQCERFNRTLIDAVRCFIGKHENQWDLYLPQIAGASRASVNRSTGFTANKLMLGREVNTPATLVFPVVKHNTDISPDNYVAKLTQEIERAHNVARANLKCSLKRMKRNYDLKVLTREYEEGDVVLVLDTASIKGKCRKLSSPWKGPGVIIKKISPYIYRVKLKTSILTMNHDRLKPCRDREFPTWVKKHKESPMGNEVVDDDDEVYCSCKRPWEGRFMIMCDYCMEWYHGSCVNISPSEALEINKYKCDKCRVGRH
jgi:hypothetical protein